MKLWSVYLLRNERGHLYTGISTDPYRRLAEHRAGTSRGAKYTRACKSLELAYCCEIGSRSMALQVEARIKRLGKSDKEELVRCGPERNLMLDRIGLADPL